MEDPEQIYEVVEQIGKNTLAGVFKAKDKRTGEVVALKVMDLGDAHEDDADVAAIIAEVGRLTKSPCPHLVRYDAARPKAATLWITLEFCEGGSVLDATRMPGGLEERHIASILHSTLLGLDYLHSNKTAHYAIKAGNILMTSGGQVKLSDFGEFEKLSHKMSKSDTFVRSPFWMAPEVIKQEGEEGPVSDIWALGIAAIEMATGSAPWADQNPMKVMFLIPKSPSPELPATFSAEFRAFVAACLTKEPDKRPTAKDLLKHAFVASAGDKTEAAVKELFARRQTFLEDEKKKRTSAGSALQQSTLQSVIYPSLARLLQACQSEEKTLAALVSVKQAFDGAERAQSGLAYSFVQQVIEVLRTNPK
eukprot:m51a1_g13085 putative severin kinase (364) ;mRNA; r:598-2390